MSSTTAAVLIVGIVATASMVSQLTRPSTAPQSAPVAVPAAAPTITPLSRSATTPEFVVEALALATGPAVGQEAPQAGWQHVAVDVRLTATDYRLPVLDSYVTLIDTEGREYRPRYSFEGMRPSLPSRTKVRLGDMWRGWVTYEILADAVPARLRFTPPNVAVEVELK